MDPTSHRMTVVTDGLQFPEGPVVLPDGGIAVVEIAAGRVTRVAPDGTKTTLSETGGGPNGAALGPDGALYVCNNGGFEWHTDPTGARHVWQCMPGAKGRIERIDLATGQCRTLYDAAGDFALSAPNDIVFDAHGGFWFTDLGAIGKREIGRGRICYARADGSFIREAIFPMLMPNGIGLSPDGKTLYVAETATARLWAFDVTAPGELALAGWPAASPGRMVWASPRYARFDSLAVEASGNVCVATLAAGGITVLSPAGEVVEFVATGDPVTTNICFGGADLRTAYVTLSGKGQLVSFPWARPGLRLTA